VPILLSPPLALWPLFARRTHPRFVPWVAGEGTVPEPSRTHRSALNACESRTSTLLSSCDSHGTTAPYSGYSDVIRTLIDPMPTNARASKAVDRGQRVIPASEPQEGTAWPEASRRLRCVTKSVTSLFPKAVDAECHHETACDRRRWSGRILRAS
jgi:hypothetical protein